jgi:Flp pilus assembly protein TadG
MFFMVMFGIIEWGNIYYVQNNMLVAARQAARNWAVNGPPSTASGAAASAATALLKAACTSFPLAGTNFSYTFSFNYFVNCTGVAMPEGTYGLATIKISTPATKVALINYLGSISSTTNINATTTIQEEFICPAAAPATSPSWAATYGPQSC